MKCLVTGAAGFIGSTLVERLIGDGHEVTGVDAFTDYYDVEQKKANTRVALAHPDYTLIEAAVSSDEFRSALAGTDVLFHLAGQPGVRLSWDANFHTYVERNVMDTQRVLEAARHADVGRIVYASSSSVYGNQSTYPCTERAVPQPFSPYGVTKLAAEHLCNLYAENYGLSTVSLRYFTVYGPRQRPDMAFSLFIRSALAGNLIAVTGDGEQVRDFTFVDDIVAANIAAGTSAVHPGSVYNVCGTESVTVNGVLQHIEAAVGCPIDIRHVEPRAGDVAKTGGVSQRAAADLGWKAEVQLADGIARQTEWERNRP